MTDLTSHNNTERGQSLVEFALFAMVIIVILAGVLDLGRMYFTFLALQDAAGEGAAYAAIHPTWVDDDPVISPDPNNITYRVQNESPDGLIDWLSTTVQVDAPTPTVGMPITVTVFYSYTLVTPIIQAIAQGEQIELRGRSVQFILTTDD